MRLTHRLRGFDKQTDELAVEFDIPDALTISLKRIVGAYQDDPDLAGLYELTPDQARTIATAINVSIDLEKYDFFLDSCADWETIRAAKSRLRV